SGTDDQNPRGQGIERPRVPHLRPRHQGGDTVDRGAGGHAPRLVNHKDSTSQVPWWSSRSLNSQTVHSAPLSGPPRPPSDELPQVVLRPLDSPPAWPKHITVRSNKLGHGRSHD